MLITKCRNATHQRKIAGSILYVEQIPIRGVQEFDRPFLIPGGGENEQRHWGKDVKRLFDYYLADQLFYFLAIVAEIKHCFAADFILEIKVNQGLIKRHHTNVPMSTYYVG